MPEKSLPRARHEPRDVGTAFIGLGVPLVVAVVLLLASLIFELFPRALLQPVLQPPFPQYAKPQLQPNPRDDMAKFYQQELQQLNGTGWIDKAHGIAHIPIADAMREVAQEGIAGWPTPVEKQP